MDYWKKKALNSTLLADYIDSPDIAKLERKPMTYFEDGKIFETLFEDLIKDTANFQEKYFVAACEHNLPDKFGEIWEQAKGQDMFDAQDAHIWEPYYVWNKPDKKGNQKLSGNHKALHAWLDLCNENPGLYPVPAQKIADMNIGIDNLLKAEIDIPYVYAGSFAELLKHEHEFQKAIYWECNGIPKKALLDIVVNVNGLWLGIDLKYMADLGRFYKMFGSKYQWQSVHYYEGLITEYENSFPSLLFAVATKSLPFLARTFYADPEEWTIINDIYTDKCHECWEWVEKGKPGKGFKPTQMLTYQIRR
jgi:hypothetical protein